MPTREELFDLLKDANEILALIGSSENLHLDCKIWPKSDNDSQKVLAKCLCGFANAEGGVAVIGMEARGGPSKDDPDLIQKAVPVADAVAVKSKIEGLVGELVEPRLQSVQTAAVLESPGSTAGFVLIDIPPTDGPPCRSRKDWKFYQRISSGTYPMEYFQIADIFGRRRRPVLSLHLEEAGVEMRKGRPVRILTLGIENRGRAIAKYPSIRFRSSAVGVDPLGIDGKGGSGLPRSPSEPSWVVFGGGADHVIHPATLLEITKVEQYVGTWLRNVGTNAVEAVHFSELSLCAWVAADEFPSTGESKTIPAETIRIENVNRP
jgi:hypothetical protein